MTELACGLDAETYERIHCVSPDADELPFGGMGIDVGPLRLRRARRPEDLGTPGLQYEASDTMTGDEGMVAISGVGSQATQRGGE